MHIRMLRMAESKEQEACVCVFCFVSRFEFVLSFYEVYIEVGASLFELLARGAQYILNPKHGFRY